ncbi:MAG TPA: hypothetical protein VGY98_07245 [Verrucomicrobiae bacterium]|nr:hypothetical protein [Verrucomicrobiae bacterium]
MKNFILLTLVIFPLTLVSARAQTVYATYDDWTNWNGGGDGAIAVGTFNYGDITVNGIGNPSLPGVSSPDGPGSLQIAPITPASGPPYADTNTVWGPGPTAAELAAMDGSGFVAPYSAASSYGPGTLVAQSGTLLVDFAMPDHTIAGSYFNLGLWANYNNAYTGWWASSLIDLGSVSTPNGPMEMYQAVIPYTFISDSNDLTYISFGLVEDTDYQGVNPWYVASMSVVPLVTPPPPPPQTSLFTTSNDFALFTSAGGDLIQATNDFYVTNATDAVNGLGNLTGAGASGTAGSLLLYWSSLESGYGSIASSLDEETNAAFMQAIDPGCNTATEASVAAYGNIYMDYSQPDNSGGGNYFTVGVNLSYSADGYYQNFFPSSTADLGYRDNSGYEVYQATIPYTITAGNYFGFTLSAAINSNYQPTNGFHIDDITVSASQAPQITSVSLNGSSLVLKGTGGLASDVFTVLGSTNLTLPLGSWKGVGAGTFYGPNWTNTITVNPGNSAEFYILKAAP